MAITAVKVGKIARTALAMLKRDLVVARTVWTDAVAGTDFEGALNDTVTVRMRARVPAKSRVLRAGTQITDSELVEFPVPVTLTDDIFQSVSISDEQLELDIVEFATQVLKPQTEAVALGVEDKMVAKITGASYPGPQTVALNPSNPAATFNRARRILNSRKVPRENRFALVGAQVEEMLLNDANFIRADARGPERANDAFSEATVGKTYGFTIVGSDAVDPNEAFAYHKTAFIAATRAPRKPDGAAFGQGVSEDGIAMRWIKDYDYRNTTDRSLVNTWFGGAVVLDPDDPEDDESTRSLVRAVKITTDADSLADDSL